MPEFTIQIGDRSYPVTHQALEALDVAELHDGEFHVLHNGKAFSCELINLDLPRKQLTLSVNGRRIELTVEDEVDQLVRELGLGVAEAAVSKNLVAPMPGLVVDVLVKEGDEVEAGTRLLILEAMKMENSLTATGSGTVTKVSVIKGQAVDKHQLLIEVA